MKFPKAAAKITEDEPELLAFYDYPAQHWIHLRTTNPIEPTFATVRLRTKVTKGHGSKTAAPAVAFKLIESAQHRWRIVNAPHLVALVRAGARREHASSSNANRPQRPDGPAPWCAAHLKEGTSPCRNPPPRLPRSSAPTSGPPTATTSPRLPR